MTDLAPVSPPSEVVAFVQMIERVARDSSIDIDRLDRLLAMRERENARRAEQAWKAAMSAAQAEMEPVRADATNDQTRSRYASHAALDGAIRAIYTGHGFGLTFDSGDAPLPTGLFLRLWLGLWLGLQHGVHGHLVIVVQRLARHDLAYPALPSRHAGGRQGCPWRPRND
jgi:hypothetical protein